jgi:hypothetical protein
MSSRTAGWNTGTDCRLIPGTARSATFGPAGGWFAPTSLQRSQHLDDDQQLCDFLVTQVVRLAFPYGWKTDQTWSELLDTGAVSTRQWWSGYGNLPYLESYRPEGAWEPDPAG